VPDGEIAAVRGAGFDDAAMVEIAAAVALNTFANLVNNLAQTSAQAESQRGIGE
jgi:alkylhydroperoxidase family enzyme